MLKISEEVDDIVDVRPTSGGGLYADLPERSGFAFHLLQPEYIAAKIDPLWHVDRMEPFAAPFTVDEVDRRVRSELDFYEKTNVRAVFIGFMLPAYLSVRIEKLPLVALVPFSFFHPFFNAGLGTWPDQFRPAILHAVSEAGSAVHLSRRGLTAARVAQAVRQLLESTSARHRAIELKRLYEAADGAQATADFLSKTVADRTEGCVK